MIGLISYALAGLKGRFREAKRWTVQWLLSDLEAELQIEDARIKALKVGEATITMSPSGVGDVIRWSATQAPVALGDLGMDVTSGKPAYHNGTSALDIAAEDLVMLLDGTNIMTADMDLGSNKITNLAAPTLASDAARKSDIDAVAAGFDPKESVRLATDTALPANTAAGTGVGKTLTGDANGALSIDGVAVVAGDRVLIKDEATTSDNGIYDVTQTGDGTNPYILTRATDFDEDDEVTNGAFVPSVNEGTVNTGTSWVLSTADTITVDTTGLTFTKGALGLTDHGDLSGLADDDHSQYTLLAGRSGGQTINGGTASSDNLTLSSTANATKGRVLVAGAVFSVDEGTGRIGTDVVTPTEAVDFQSVTSGSNLRLGAGGSVGDIVPETTGNGNVGTSSLKWASVNADTVNSGDINMVRLDRGAAWTFAEFDDGVYAVNRMTGNWFQLGMSPCDPKCPDSELAPIEALAAK